ncbi:MAG: hypothetical protein ACREIA_04940 [Opitutaceae bacterium]
MLAELDRCRQASGDGYNGGIPGSRAFWAGLAAGRFEARRFDINGKWVPWHNAHKTFAGLRDAWMVGGQREFTTEEPRTRRRDRRASLCRSVLINVFEQ